MRVVNKSDLLIIAKNSGRLMVGIGLMCLVPILFDLIYFEFNALWYLVPALISIITGLIFEYVLDKYKINKMRLKHGMIVSALIWLWASLICGLAFCFITDINIIDGIFESMSALTGSGITIYPDVEILPKSILFFRAFQQWIGGLGIIVLIISFMSKPGNRSSRLYQSEAGDERFRPSIRTTIIETIKIYSIYTIAGIILYVAAGMPVFDSLCHTFSTISTGGMSVKNANIGYYHNDIINLITIVLMILGATSFFVHYRLIKTRGKSINEYQFKVMISLIAGTSLLIYFISNIVPMDILFHIVSAITTTGASIQSSTVMGGWPPNVLIIVMILMLIGGSNGSTVGAIKLMRVITFFKAIYNNLIQILYTYSVVNVKINNKTIKSDVVAQSGSFITLYLVFIVFTWILLCSYGHDPFDSLFFSISMQGNVGLEIGHISQTLELPLKVVGIFSMWIGRLEIYPVLITLRAFLQVFKRK